MVSSNSENIFPAEIDMLIESTVMDILTSAMELAWPSMPNLHENMYAEFGEVIASVGLIVYKTVENLKDNIKNEDSRLVFDKEATSLFLKMPKKISEVLLRKYSDRWAKRSLVAGKKVLPAKKSIDTPKICKNDNHFIPRSFLKRYWSKNDSIRVCRIINGKIEYKITSFGNWGYRINLYSLFSENKFQLIEGHALERIPKVLNLKGLNPLDQESLVWFLAMQFLRSPSYIDNLYSNIIGILSKYGAKNIPSNEQLQSVYDLMIKNNRTFEMWHEELIGNEWCLLHSEKSQFVFPDNSGLVGYLNGEKYVIFPIDPNYCFCVLPKKMKKEPRLYIKHIEVNSVISGLIYNLLATGCVKEFVGDVARSDYSLDMQLRDDDFASIFGFIEKKLDNS
ncbi:DUF4238 domain-containing protein [Solidesulfovibrio sp. C21]|uniref:DUF4238 domain-containing protein n=1 Tax=Solidesulfovibrio sp. C21 TaxID=3398613 RepID=UPI0039FBB4C7